MEKTLLQIQKRFNTIIVSYSPVKPQENKIKQKTFVQQNFNFK